MGKDVHDVPPTVFLALCFASVPCLVLPMSASAQVSAGAPPRDAQPRFLMSAISPVWQMQTPRAKRIGSGAKTLLATTGPVVLSDIVGFVFAGCLLASSRYSNCGLRAVGSVAIAVMGPAAGATLTGARFGPSAVGSAVGLVAGAGAAAIMPAGGVLAFVVVHAGITALFANATR